MVERRLVGHGPSIYTWIARLVMAELGRDWVDEEVDPFARPRPARLLALNPAGKVPVLVEGDLVLAETRAITAHLAQGSALIPQAAGDRARMQQMIAMLDADAYWPLVRQVYAHAVYRPFEGVEGAAGEIAEGLARAGPVLARLEAQVGGHALIGGRQSLADCHAAPMIHALARAGAGRALLDRYRGLSHWYAAQAARPAFGATRPPPPA